MLLLLLLLLLFGDVRVCRLVCFERRVARTVYGHGGVCSIVWVVLRILRVAFVLLVAFMPISRSVLLCVASGCGSRCFMLVVLGVLNASPVVNDCRWCRCCC